MLLCGAVSGNTSIPRVRLGGGYGYLTYHSGVGPFRQNKEGQNLHRHVMPLVLQYRPATPFTWRWVGPSMTMAAGDSQARLGRPPTGRRRAATGLSLAYSYYDVIEFFGPFRGPWGLFFDDFAGYNRYRYGIVNPIGLWSQSFFGAVGLQHPGRDPEDPHSRHHPLGVSGPGGEAYPGGLRRRELLFRWQFSADMERHLTVSGGSGAAPQTQIHF